jgi:hypothetical protein
MMTQGHRLARLEVGEARHDARGMFLGAVDQDRFQYIDAGNRLVRRAAHEQPEVGCHLVVA